MAEKTYAELVAERAAVLGRARLADPAEHFPYKREAARRAAEDDTAPAKVWVWDPRRGLVPEDRPTADFLPEAVADATEAYVAAQAAYLAAPGAGTKADYEAIRDALVAVRQEHRRGRVTHGIAADEVRF
jgi:hypothetical protein